MKYPSKAVVAICLFTGVLVELLSASRAQGGGKAEPLALKFSHGMINTVVTGNVKSSEEMEFGFSGKRGGHLRVILESVPRASGMVKLMRAGGTMITVKRVKENFEADTKVEGDYIISVYRASPTKRGRTKFRAKVIYKIKPTKSKSRSH
ncbi:MAG: hypothetical protein ABJA67_16375 [Chthonomonadales bacterium]